MQFFSGVDDDSVRVSEQIPHRQSRPEMPHLENVTKLDLLLRLNTVCLGKPLTQDSLVDVLLKFHRVVKGTCVARTSLHSYGSSALSMSR
jgi:hypothetical protein